MKKSNQKTLIGISVNNKLRM